LKPPLRALARRLIPRSVRVSRYWGRQRPSGQIISWLEHPTVLRNVSRRVTGNPDVGTHQWFKDRFFASPASLCLSLGCGFGGFERLAVSLGISERLDANDLSSGAIDAATKNAESAGLADRLNYRVANLDSISLPQRSYDAIFALSCVHHVQNLEHLFEQCRRTLKPDGLLFLDEYIGPTRFQTAPAVTAIINRELRSLPVQYRRSLIHHDGRIIDSYEPAPIEVFLQNDPSEAIRSADIVPLLKQYFDIVEYRPYGGAIQHMLLSGITGNFDPNKDEDNERLNRYARLEEEMERDGLIDSDFAAIVAKPGN
jgi:2-polyprenyl-3-methyl-5-hydroxy-6-metoxy-1,4-benzoquinol methylase